MSKLSFNPTLEPTLGVELELALVDERTMELSSSIQHILDRVPAEFAGTIKPELMQCYLEINTGVCHTAAEAEADLRRKVEVVESIAGEIDVCLLWTATHPFSLWRDQQIVPTERYKMLLNLLQDTARQLITFGLHVHVGVESGDKAVMICDRIMQHLPVLLALSCNSPCWDGRITGLHSSRSKIMEGLPTAGLPTLMRNWSEYTWLINHLVATGFINTIREIWWDVRPHHNFGTVEIRVCDMPGSLPDSLAIAALIQCLVKALSDEIDQGTYQHDCHPMIVRQNKWRACRYGLEAQLVDSYTYEVHSARELVQDMVRWLEPTAVELNCQEYLGRVLDLAAGPSWAERQLTMLEKLRDPAEVVRRMTQESKLRA